MNLTMECPKLHPTPVKSPMYHLGLISLSQYNLYLELGIGSFWLYLTIRYIWVDKRASNILSVSDIFPKFWWTKALSTKEAKSIVATLEEVLNI